MRTWHALIFPQAYIKAFKPAPGFLLRNAAGLRQGCPDQRSRNPWHCALGSAQQRGKAPPTRRTSPPCMVPPPLLALPVMGGGVCVFFFCEEGESELCLAALYYSLHNCYVLLEI